MKKVDKKPKRVMKKRTEKRGDEFTLALNVAELTHLRDLFSVFLDSDRTMSEVLCTQQEHPVRASQVEQGLWEKLACACAEAGIPLEAAAPNFGVSFCAPPALGIFRFDEGVD